MKFVGGADDRMFHVLVLGGIALVACGGATTTDASGLTDAEPQEASAGDGSFPSETNAAPLDAATETAVVFPSETATPYDASFPSELPPPPPDLDAGSPDAHAASDAGAYADAAQGSGYCVPCEAPAPSQ